LSAIEPPPVTPAEQPSYLTSPGVNGGIPQPEEPGARRQAARWVLPVATGVAGLLLGIAGTVGVSAVRAAADERAATKAATAALESRRAVLTTAVGACNLKSATGIDLGDGGTTLTFNMKGNDESSGASIGDITCIFAALHIPANVTSHIDQTTSMDGRQEETWNGITISWSYHPDRGLDGVLTVDATE
jgi:hypothetical protein